MTLLCSFAELSKVLEPGKAAKTDKSSIITDAIRVVTQLRAENGQLRQLNKFLEVGAPSPNLALTPSHARYRASMPGENSASFPAMRSPL